jgi:hypothetical protein
MKNGILLLFFVISVGFAEKAREQGDENYKGWKKGDWVSVVVTTRDWSRGGEPKYDSPLEIYWGKIEGIASGTLIVKKYFLARFQSFDEFTRLSKEEARARIEKTDPRRENVATAKIYDVREWIKGDNPPRPSFMDILK